MTEKRTPVNRRRGDRRSGERVKHVVIEICHSVLRTAILKQTSPNDPATILTSEIPWRFETKNFHSELASQEIAVAIRKLFHKERLNGVAVHLLLGGELCVTRVVNGENEYVCKEISHLEERSQQYLSLGTGEKSIAGSVRQIDARHRHALLTVTNHKTLEVLLSAAQIAGVSIKTIIPSLVAIGSLTYEVEQNDEPCLIIHRDEDSIELGICHQGLLLLEYRPSGKPIDGNISEFIDKHFARLRRYCNRNYQHIEKPLKNIFFSGDEKLAQEDVIAFAAQSSIQASTLKLAKLEGRWDFLDKVPGPEMAPVMGLIVILESDDTTALGPNLMAQIIERSKESIRPILAKSAIPIAALLLISAVLWSVGFFQKKEIDSIQAELNALGHDRVRTTELNLQFQNNSSKLSQLKTIASKLPNPSWASAISLIGHCMPNDVWLDHIKIKAGENIQLSGVSYTESGVYEFVQWLDAVPVMEKVAIDGTHTAMTQNGLATNFEIGLKLTNMENFEVYGE